MTANAHGFAQAFQKRAKTRARLYQTAHRRTLSKTYLTGLSNVNMLSLKITVPCCLICANVETGTFFLKGGQTLLFCQKLPPRLVGAASNGKRVGRLPQ